MRSGERGGGREPQRRERGGDRIDERVIFGPAPPDGRLHEQEGERRDEILGERRRYEERVRALFREGRELGELRTDLDDATAALLTLSAANWAYTWLQPGRDTDELADRFYAVLIDGMRGYATPV